MKHENSRLLNEIDKKDNELYLINQKFTLNMDTYNSLKLKFDEFELKYTNISDELFLTRNETNKINYEIKKIQNDNIEDHDQVEIINKDLMLKEAHEILLIKQVEVLYTN